MAVLVERSKELAKRSRDFIQVKFDTNILPPFFVPLSSFFFEAFYFYILRFTRFFLFFFFLLFPIRCKKKEFSPQAPPTPRHRKKLRK